MPLMYYPSAGEILLCDYTTGFIEPEMVKLRPVLVVSPRLRRRAELVAVIPLSTTAPNNVEPHHCELTLAQPLPPPFDTQTMWAKCDMLATIALARLDRFKAGRREGKRIYLSGHVDRHQLAAVRRAILCGLGMSELTIHIP